MKPEEDKREYGRGNRVRKQVSYALDIPNDERWGGSMEEEDEEEAVSFLCTMINYNTKIGYSIRNVRKGKETKEDKSSKDSIRRRKQ